MGEGILDYVNRIRINKAKEIIATRRYSTEEAGKMVGYTSNQTFRRAFVKIVGMPPGKYSESLQNK
jgi:AraC-like DNA-binding protein